jgi:hypothetical protein
MMESIDDIRRSTTEEWKVRRTERGPVFEHRSGARAYINHQQIRLENGAGEVVDTSVVPKQSGTTILKHYVTERGADSGPDVPVP